jgi:ABC-type branched-subunit amino acid transport system substrate-binding protein
MERAGYKGALVNYIQYSPATVAQAKGDYVYLQFAPFESASSNPAIALMVQRVRKISATAPLTQGIEAGYFAADQFIDALQKAGRNLTAESLQKAADHMTYGIRNTVGPTTFPRGQTIPTSCGTTVTSNGTAWVVAYPYLCTNAVKYVAK